MPSTYAHYRFGLEVVKELEEMEKEVTDAYPELFLIGLHGPDILFHYKPLFCHPVNQIGYQMHEKSGEEFFSHAAQVIREHSYHVAYIAYIYGFICHFALDETCHGYIDDKIAVSGISHTEIEVEFDRALMIQDRLDPIRHKLTHHIIPSEENAKIIREFFPKTNVKQIKKALQTMILDDNLLVAPSKIKRQLIYSLLQITGNYKEMHGLLVNYEENPACKDSTKKLFELYKEAEKLAVSLIHEYRDYIKGKKPLNEIYRYTFGSRLPEESLQKEDERNLNISDLNDAKAGR